MGAESTPTIKSSAAQNGGSRRYTGACFCNETNVVSLAGKLWLFSGKTDGDKYCEDMLYYDPLDDEWVSHAGLQPPRLHIGCAFMGKHIFVFGGEDQRVGDQDPPVAISKAIT